MQKLSWKVIDTPLGYDFFERLHAFSFPRDNELVLMSDQGIHLVDLRDPSDIQDDFNYPRGEHLFDAETAMLTYQGRSFSMLGPGIGQPITKSSFGEELQLDLAHEVFFVKDSNGETLFDFLFESDSDEWGIISFSEDSQYILLGIPHDIYIFERITPSSGSHRW